MAREKKPVHRVQMTEGKRNIIHQLLEEYDIQSAEDIQDALKDLLEDENPEVLLPHFSCHSLRHTFTTRMCEAGVNIKVIQDALGHSDISTTLNIYADVTKETKKKEFIGLDEWFQKEA